MHFSTLFTQNTHWWPNFSLISDLGPWRQVFSKSHLSQNKDSASSSLFRISAVSAFRTVQFIFRIAFTLHDMPVCKYYQEGRCRFGNDCKFEHVGRTVSSSRPPSDPFARPMKSGNSSKIDNRPLWPLSSLALTGNSLSGNAVDADISPEELRAMAYTHALKGQGAEVIQKESALVTEHRAKLDEVSHHVAGQPNSLSGGQIPTNDPFSSFNSIQPNFPQAASSSGMELATDSFTTQHLLTPQSHPFGVASTISDTFAGGESQSTYRNAIITQSQPSPIATHHSNNIQPNADNVQAKNEQFMASHFTFENVPETAPLPQFYWFVPR